MPQLNPDEAATDEPTTYKDEAIGGDDSNDLSDIKGDLVDEDDGDPIRQSYEVRKLITFLCISFSSNGKISYYITGNSL